MTQAAENLFDIGAHPQRPRKPRPQKAAGAFLTIGELADQLQIEQHVLRFWESKFPQIQPLKRAGGRRYYRPDDVALLERIQMLLYRDGYTIRGVQNLLAAEAGGQIPTGVIHPFTPPVKEPSAFTTNLQRLEALTTVDEALAASGRMLFKEMNLLAAANESSTAPVENQNDPDHIRIRRDDLQKLVSELVELRRMLAADSE